MNKILYKDQTGNIEKRHLEQNAGKVRSTQAFRPWKLVYSEEYETREEAVKREKYLKSGYGRLFLKKKLGSEG